MEPLAQNLGVSVVGGGSVFSLVLLICTFLFLGMEAFWFTRKQFFSPPSVGPATRSELAWTLVPASILLIMALINRATYSL